MPTSATSSRSVVALDDLVRDARERPVDRLGVENDLPGRHARLAQGAGRVAGVRACSVIQLLSGLAGPGLKDCARGTLAAVAGRWSARLLSARQLRDVEVGACATRRAGVAAARFVASGSTPTRSPCRERRRLDERAAPRCVGVLIRALRRRRSDPQQTLRRVGTRLDRDRASSDVSAAAPTVGSQLDASCVDGTKARVQRTFRLDDQRRRRSRRPSRRAAAGRMPSPAEAECSDDAASRWQAHCERIPRRRVRVCGARRRAADHFDRDARRGGARARRRRPVGSVQRRRAADA